ncbi:membrane protein [Streptomyces sp. 150FB]|nr:membrane protein [Streptomyces sp. 150FB]
MARRPVAWVAAVVLVLEALGVVLVNALLAEVVDNQHMSLAGLASNAMSRGAWVLGVLAAVYLVVCGVFLVRMALRNRAPGRVGRIVLISCAVVHGVLGALAVGLLGWLAFVAMVVVLALLVWVLVAYGTGEPESRAVAAAEPPAVSA